MSDKYDCQTCGACCVYYEGIDILDSDKNFKYLNKLGFIREDLEFGGFEMETIPENGFKRCIALDGAVCESVSCSVYKKRPETCRDYEPGSIRCQTARNVVFEKFGKEYE